MINVQETSRMGLLQMETIEIHTKQVIESGDTRYRFTCAKGQMTYVFFEQGTIGQYSYKKSIKCT